jgi:hypothetical protein
MVFKAIGVDDLGKEILVRAKGADCLCQRGSMLRFVPGEGLRMIAMPIPPKALWSSSSSNIDLALEHGSCFPQTHMYIHLIGLF